VKEHGSYAAGAGIAYKNRVSEIPAVQPGAFGIRAVDLDVIVPLIPQTSS
jgi:hypothetical protein